MSGYGVWERRSGGCKIWENKFMVKELKEVLTKVEALNENEQRLIAELLAQEIAWDKTLNDSQEFLSSLADEAIQAHKEGKTAKTDW